MENGGDPEHFTDGQAEKDRYHKINWKRSPLITCMHTYTGWPGVAECHTADQEQRCIFPQFQPTSLLGGSPADLNDFFEPSMTKSFSRAGPGKATRPDSLAAGKHSPVENSWSQLP